MGVPYNFLQELSGAGRTVSPSEFDDSLRYIGGENKDNVYIPKEIEKGSLSVSLNSYQKRAATELALNSLDLNGLFDVKLVPKETGFIGLSFLRNKITKECFDTGNLSLSISNSLIHFPLETGSVFLGLALSFDSGVSNAYNLDLNFNPVFSGVIEDSPSGALTLEAFVKYVNKANSSLQFELNTGNYNGGALMSQIDYGNLSLIFSTGSYGP